MKTLDKVIKAYEQCAKPDLEEGCGDCAYRNEKCGSCKCVRNDDALHYLRMLKLYRQTPLAQSIHKMQKEYALYPTEDWGEDEPDFNPALTWSELKQMEGKPVWIVPEEEKGYWFVIEFFNNNPYYGGDRVCFTNDVMLNRCDLGKTWQAYRKERV